MTKALDSSNAEGLDRIKVEAIWLLARAHRLLDTRNTDQFETEHNRLFWMYLNAAWDTIGRVELLKREQAGVLSEAPSLSIPLRAIAL